MAAAQDIAQVWMQIEDDLFPYLRLDPLERVIYYRLFRHSRLNGTNVLRTSTRELARGTGIAATTIVRRLRSLAAKGCLRLLAWGNEGTTLQVIAPGEIQGSVPPHPDGIDLESANCFRNPNLREAILRREQGRCFYCLREIRGRTVLFDHVVPRAHGGDHSYRNVVACCLPCNAGKGRRSPADYLRTLYRTNRLSRAELDVILSEAKDLKPTTL